MSDVPRPPRIAHARDLLIKDLRKLLTTEEMLSRSMLPKMQQEISDEELKSAVSEHLEQTRAHVENVRKAFASLDTSPSGADAKGLEGLNQERESTVQDLQPALRDGFNASAAVGTEHYEIASYEAAIRLADAAGEQEVARLLHENLKQEVDALNKLAQHATRLAEQGAKKPAVS
jgi:ferritin-like metal-binding protein YciE